MTTFEFYVAQAVTFEARARNEQDDKIAANLYAAARSNWKAASKYADSAPSK